MPAALLGINDYKHADLLLDSRDGLVDVLALATPLVRVWSMFEPANGRSLVVDLSDDILLAKDFFSQCLAGRT